LHADLAAQLALDKILQTVGNLAALNADAAFQITCDVFGPSTHTQSQARPALCRIEGDNLSHAGVFATQQVGDQGRIIDALVGLAEGRAAAEIFEETNPGPNGRLE
jgi:hypothetical protein